MYRWHDAIRTLGKLHRIDPAMVNLEKFGPPSSFYNRQVKTLSTISESQAKVVDIESKEVVGKIPHFDDMVSFFRDPQTQPKDRATLVHGDYKIDNLVYHKTEPRVIGILEYVGCTTILDVHFDRVTQLGNVHHRPSTLRPLKSLDTLHLCPDHLPNDLSAPASYQSCLLSLLADTRSSHTRPMHGMVCRDCRLGSPSRKCLGRCLWMFQK